MATPQEQPLDDRSFLGTGWAFPPTFPSAARTVVMASDEEDIRQSLAILLSTRIGERVMQPKYGCDLHDMVFEPLDVGLRASLRDLIEVAILYFEPRIILDDVVLEDVPERGLVEVTLDYVIATTNTRSNFVYPLYLDEGTELQV
ncbi:MAG: GPW/gp25 family protein [Ilumatobacter sp.]|uniref:GPW/gp25 family protein n=1 Tax=Ilumatobacter sp. TaxID=1967498 RepID=UPI002610E8EC|nr:GPW/gp25 family protein [Ilumatobacter sp.]MDJ0768461.1 GPW/gp25 family protein [Ilumatobacter sp.]